MIERESSLRHPSERWVFTLFVVLNIAILVGAVWVIAYSPHWLTAHPWLEKRVQQLRLVAIAAVLAAPALVFARNARWAVTHWNGIRLSVHQLPEIHAILRRQCAMFGMREVPELYASDAETSIARAYSAWHRHYIVLSDKLLQPDMTPILDAIAFQIGREVGRIRLGYTRWWDELLLSYVVRIPVLRNPLWHLRAYSADRYGAFLEPDGVRGLLVLASGRLMLPRVDVAEYLREVPDVSGVSALVAVAGERWPPIGRRVRALYKAGLLKNSASS